MAEPPLLASAARAQWSQAISWKAPWLILERDHMWIALTDEDLANICAHGRLCACNAHGDLFEAGWQPLPEGHIKAKLPENAVTNLIEKGGIGIVGWQFFLRKEAGRILQANFFMTVRELMGCPLRHLTAVHLYG